MKNSKIMKDALALFLITLISGLLLGFVYEITKEPIEKQKAIAKQEAYQKVFPAADSFQETEELNKAAEQSALLLDKEGYQNILIDEARLALDESGDVLGYVLTVTTKNGYGNAITLTLGKALDNTIQGIEFLSISETAGLGMKAKEPDFKDQFKQKKAEALSDADIDFITGATITSAAVTEAVNAGSSFIHHCIAEQGMGKK